MPGFVQNDVENSKCCFYLEMIQMIGMRAVGEEACLFDQDHGVEEIHRFTEETFTNWLCRKMVNRLQISHILHTPLLTKFRQCVLLQGLFERKQKMSHWSC